MELKHDKEILDIEKRIEMELFAFEQMKVIGEQTNEEIDNNIMTWRTIRLPKLLQQIKDLETLQSPMAVELVI